MLSDSRIQPLVGLLSLVGALIIFSQFLDLWWIAAAGTGAKSPAEWRFTMFGAFAGRVPLLVLGDVVLFVGIIRQGNRAAFLRMGWIHLVLTLLLLIGLLVLSGDTRSLRSTNPDRVVNLTAIRVSITLALTALLTVLTGWFAVRNSRRPKWVGRKRRQAPLLTDTEDHHIPGRSGISGDR